MNWTTSLKKGEDMIKIFVTGLLWSFFIPFAFSQNVEDYTFLKSIEADYTCRSKGDIEKLFWGHFNAPIEFFHSPAFEGASGFRILMDSLNNSYILEIKYNSNIEWVRTSNQSEWLKQIKVESLSFSISAHFAEKLYKKMISFIKNYNVKRMPRIIVDGYLVMPCMPLDGYSVTFRIVVDNAAWSLWISNPQGKDALKMADLCRLIITDAQTNQLDESKYMTILNTFEN